MSKIKIEVLRIGETVGAVVCGAAIATALFTSLSMEVFLGIVAGALIALLSMFGRDALVVGMAQESAEAAQREAVRPPPAVLPLHLIEAHQRQISGIQQIARAATQAEIQGGDIVAMLTELSAYVASVEAERDAYRQQASEQHSQIEQIAGVIGRTSAIQFEPMMRPMAVPVPLTAQDQPYVDDGKPIPGFLAEGPADDEVRRFAPPRYRNPGDAALAAIEHALSSAAPEPALR